MNAYQAELYHHGIKGQRWGVRRYQNADGSLTAAGKARYGVNEDGYLSKRGSRKFEKDQHKRLHKGFRVEYTDDGVITDIKDRFGNNVSDQEFAAYQAYHARQAKRGLAASTAILASIGAVGVASLLTNGH